MYTSYNEWGRRWKTSTLDWLWFCTFIISRKSYKTLCTTSKILSKHERISSSFSRVLFCRNCILSYTFSSRKNADPFMVQRVIKYGFMIFQKFGKHESREIFVFVCIKTLNVYLLKFWPVSFCLMKLCSVSVCPRPHLRQELPSHGLSVEFLV